MFATFASLWLGCTLINLLDVYQRKEEACETAVRQLAPTYFRDVKLVLYGEHSRKEWLDSAKRLCYLIPRLLEVMGR